MKEGEVNSEDDHRKAHFMFLAVGQSAVYAFSMGFAQKEWNVFCEGIWETMIMNGAKEFNEILKVAQAKDLKKMRKEKK